MLPPEEFKNSLIKELGIKKPVAEKINQEIYRTVFSPVKYQLFQLYEQGKVAGEIPKTTFKKDIEEVEEKRMGYENIEEQPEKQENTKEPAPELKKEQSTKENKEEVEKQPEKNIGPDTYREPIE